MKAIGLWTMLLLAGCGQGEGTTVARPQEAAVETHDHEAESEVSDLDRPVEELFAASCEHAVKTYACDECRYEVGVVRAPATLFTEGLLTTVKAEQRRVGLPLTLTGEVSFDERRVAHVSSQAGGVVRRVHVRLGDRVRQGQPLLEIESVAVGEAQGAFLETQALLVLARRNFERVDALRADSIASEREFLEARQERDTAEIRSDGALGLLVRLGVEPDEAETLTPQTARGRLVLRSPIDGMVLVMHGVPGEVTPAEEPLLTIGDNSTLWVWADLYERDVVHFDRRQRGERLPAAVSVNAFPDEEFPGTVDLVSPTMEEASRTVKVRIELQNPQGRLLPGMFAQVKVFLPGEQHALALPQSAVMEDEGRSFVFVHHQGDYYVRRPIETARAWDGWCEIAGGLAGGEIVVADGAFLLKSDVLRSKMGAGCAD